MPAKLVAEEGLLQGLVLSFDEGDQWILGRDAEESQLVVADPATSRQHLRAQKTPQGIVIENLSHTNPVQVNDEELTTPRLLQHGDALKIGSSRFRFYTEIEGLDGGDEEPPKPLPVDELLEESSIEEPSEHHEEEFLPEDQDNGMLAKVDFGLDDSGPFMLKVISGPNNGAEFSMDPGRAYILGTAPNLCDVVFHDISVSRQHAKLTVEDDKDLFIEDLGSRNGTFVDDAKIKEKVPLAQNSVVSLGTTRFIVFDREGERQTIITPLLPSIVKSLQKEEEKKSEKKEKKAPLLPPIPPPPKPNYLVRTLAMLGATILLAIIGLGTATLFRSNEITTPQFDTSAELTRVFAAYPSLQYSFSKDNGRLLIVGHVLTATDKNQLMYALQSLPFVRSVDDSAIIIDEYIWRETNQILGKNPLWRGISVRSPTPGRFIIEGYLKSKKQADELNDYLVQNFAYIDRLEKRVIVEEEELTSINVMLQEKGFRDVSAEISGGEVTLTGSMPAERAQALEDLIKKIKERPTVRLVKNYVAELEPERSIVDITSSYNVSGSSNVGGVNTSIVINGRILTKGDQLDGMTITEITPNTIYLQREGVKYKIEYNR